MSMPPLYSCEVCGHQIDPSAKTSLQLVTVWVRGSSKTVVATEDKHYRYRHEICVRLDPTDQSLF